MMFGHISQKIIMLIFGVITVFVPIFLSACVSQEAPASEVVLHNAAERYISCLVTTASRLDDKKSDASSVALALLPFCREEFQTYVKLSGQHLNPEARLMFENKAEAGQLEIATSAVLTSRRQTAQ